MSNYEQQAHKLKILGHPIRLQIVDMLRAGECCVCHIEAALGRRQAYISQHLMALRDADLVEWRKDGLKVYYRLVDADVLRLLDFLCGAGNSEQASFADCPCPTCSNHLEKL